MRKRDVLRNVLDIVLPVHIVNNRNALVVVRKAPQHKDYLIVAAALEEVLHVPGR